MALENNFVLAAHQMRIDQWQAGCQATRLHHQLALAALADMKRRGIDHHQQFGTGLFGLARGFFKPGVFADQQADADGAACGFVAFHLENAGALSRREITALVKHLVIGQFALGIGVDDAAFPQYPGRIVALLDGHAFGAQAGAAVTAGRSANHHRQVL